jgi:N,N'-diacetyllegionaminate synthase
MMDPKTLIIAEAGVNHNGSLLIAKQLVDAAKESGADIVKFQTFKASLISTKLAKKAKYQSELTNSTESQYEMLKKLELNYSDHLDLIDYCRQKDITFLSTAFDRESIALLKKLNIPFFKTPSGEITNLPYLRDIGEAGLPVIVSTGMSTMEEIDDALVILQQAGTAKENITVLQCNTEYPTPVEDVNLNAMLAIQKKFNINVGYSDHTKGIEIPIAAVALGARVIEKHLTLDRQMEGPDHRASLEPNELKAMVRAIRNIEKALGDGNKKPSASEMKNIPIVRKSIVAKMDISKGDLFTENNLTVKRPGTGVSPMVWDIYIGKKADRNYQMDDLIQ